jgi:hypothetical protein
VAVKRDIKIASIVLAVIVVLTVGIVLYGSGVFAPTEQLQTEGFRATDPETYEATFYSNKIEMAVISADVGLVEPVQELAGMTFYISHGTGVLDSLYLEFTPTNPGGFIQLYLEKPGAQIWPPMIFQTSPDGRSTIVGVSDLGLLGIGTIGLNFYIDPSGTTSFWFEVNFTMHTAGFPPTHQAGSAQVQLPLTYANAT